MMLSEIPRKRATASSQYKKELRINQSIVSKLSVSKPLLPRPTSQKWRAQWMQEYRKLAKGSTSGTLTPSIVMPRYGKSYIFRRNIPADKARTDRSNMAWWTCPEPDGKITWPALL